MIIKNTLDQLKKPILGQIRFSDVYPENESENEKKWWQRIDFDARITDKVESGGFQIFEQIPIGFNAWTTSYGLLLVDDLLAGRNTRVAKQIKDNKAQHPDLIKEVKDIEEGSVIAMANYAPRDDQNTVKHQNGSDFYLAITESGLEIYVTPLNFLSSLEARGRILALYRIPTKGHPEFSGEHEQFRSARIIRTRRHPNHLDPVYEYQNIDELLEAKKQGLHKSPIPIDEREGYISFVDKFGNIKLELNDTSAIQNLKTGQSAKLIIKQDNQEQEFIIHKASDLKSAELDKLSFYVNVSDKIDEHSKTGLVELIVRVNGNPSTSEKTAIYQVLEKLPNLDPRKASVKFI